MNILDVPSSKLRMTPWKRFTREASDTNSAGNLVQLPAGISPFDYADIIYGKQARESFAAPFNFIARDNKTRTYDPYTEDPQVFSNKYSPDNFLDDSMNQIKEVSDIWKSMGLPFKMDEDRGYNVPDISGFTDKVLEEDPHALSLYKERYSDICFVAGFLDNALKYSLVRTITDGWWLVSYAGNVGTITPDIEKALNVFDTYLEYLFDTPEFRLKLDVTISDQGDPLNTNVGAPFFSNEYKDGRPIAKEKAVELWAKSKPGESDVDFSKWKTNVGLRTEKPPFNAYPLAIAPNRRIQAGAKPQKIWRRGERYLELAYEQNVLNTIRFVAMPPYPANLCMSAYQSSLKTVRKVTHGTFMDSDSKIDICKALSSGYYTIENDYSNYDRFILYSIILRIIDSYSRKVKSGGFFYQTLRHFFENVPLIWPLRDKHTPNAFTIVNARLTGLLSGVKVTSEIGTLVNVIICIAAGLKSGVMNQDYALKLLKGKTQKKSISEFDNFFLVQSDDTLFCSRNMTDLVRWAKAFKQITKDAGLKAKVAVGDRYLMRHMQFGLDIPVLSRVFQNTISNEDPKPDALLVAVGLASRTDGIGGHRTVDAFQLGHSFKPPSMYSKLEQIILRDLLKVFTKQGTHTDEITDFLNNLKLASSVNLGIAKGVNMSTLTEVNANLSAFRTRMVQLLAKQQLLLANSKADLYQAGSLVSALHDQYSGSGVMMFNLLSTLDNSIAKFGSQVTARDHAFYLDAMNALKLPLNIHR